MREPTPHPILVMPEQEHAVEQTPEKQPPEGTPDRDDSVGPDNIPGYDHVQNLAEYLAGLQSESVALTMDQATDLIRLWHELSQYDRQATVFSPRHRSRQTKGNFRATKRIVAPGVESTKRCILGPNAGPAQWPDCNRYVEATISRLCEGFPHSRRMEGGTNWTRWAMVTRAYGHIRQCVLGNRHVMRETKLQLPQINKATLLQWYNQRGKSQERDVLQQGIHFMPSETTVRSLPAPLAKPASLPSGSTDDAARHHFPSPVNTAGTARLKRRGTSGMAAVAIMPLPTQPLPPPPLQNIAVYVAPPVYSMLPVPYTTQRYQKRKAEQEQQGIFHRKYNKKSGIVVCKQCRQQRTAPDHQQYFGNWYCAQTATISIDEWRNGLLAKGYGKKKK